MTLPSFQTFRNSQLSSLEATLPSPSPTSTRTYQPTITPVPPSSSLGGWLVFSSIRADTNGDSVIGFGDAWHLYTLELATGQEIAITSGEYSDIHPSWSPDGEQIVFSSNRTDKGSFDLFVINRDGSSLQQLTQIPEDAKNPVWSPDGVHIAFVMTQIAENGTEYHQIGLYSLNNGQVSQLTHSLDRNEISKEPAWSPDGRYLAFTTREKALLDNSKYVTNIHLIELATLERFKLQRDDELAYDVRYPNWMPSENYVIGWLVSDNDSYPPDQIFFELEWINCVPTLTQLPIVFRHVSSNPVWGANGDWIVYTTDNSEKWRVSETGDDAVEIVVAPINLHSLLSDNSSQNRIILSDNLYRIFEFLTDNQYIENYVDWTPE